MPWVSHTDPMARGHRMPAMPGPESLAHEARPPGMRRLRASNLGDCGNDIAGHAQAVEPVVSCDVVRNQSENRRQRFGVAAGSGIGELPYRLDVAAQTEACDGSSWARPTFWNGGGRRNIRRCSEGREAWTGGSRQELGADRGGD